MSDTPPEGAARAWEKRCAGCDLLLPCSRDASLSAFRWLPSWARACGRCRECEREDRSAAQQRSRDRRAPPDQSARLRSLATDYRRMGEAADDPTTRRRLLRAANDYEAMARQAAAGTLDTDDGETQHAATKRHRRTSRQ